MIWIIVHKHSDMMVQEVKATTFGELWENINEEYRTDNYILMPVTA